jgi:hypothetical protein
MTKRVLSIVIAVLLVSSFAAMAGVEGDFTFDISIYPQVSDGMTLNEISKFDFDFQGILDLDITISGLTVGTDLAFGIAGIEHFIATISTTLGALSITDEFVFAAPYDEVETCYKVVNHVLVEDPDGPICFSNYPRISDLQFVKKRVTTSLTIAGVTFDALVMFEDVNFSHPYTPPYQTPSYQFGAIVTISGETVSGITVTSKTGINAGWYSYYYTALHSKLFVLHYLPMQFYKNTIKKYTWYEAVVPGFFKERISIEGISIAGLTIDSYTYLVMDLDDMTADWDQVLRVSFSIAGIADVTAALFSDNPLSFALAAGVYTLTTDFLSIQWVDDGDLTFTLGDDVLVLATIPIQNAEFTFGAQIIPTIGIDFAFFEAELPISFPEPIGTLEIQAEYVLVDDVLEFDTIEFALEKEFEHNAYEIFAKFSKDILLEAGIEIEVDWSL